MHCVWSQALQNILNRTFTASLYEEEVPQDPLGGLKYQFDIQIGGSVVQHDYSILSWKETDGEYVINRVNKTYNWGNYMGWSECYRMAAFSGGDSEECSSFVKNRAVLVRLAYGPVENVNLYQRGKRRLCWNHVHF